MKMFGVRPAKGFGCGLLLIRRIHCEESLNG